MADVKISGLPASTTPLAGTEVLPIVQGTTTKQVSVTNLTAGRAVSAASVAVTSSTAATNGMHLLTTNTLGITTNSTTAIRIDASQNVGINTVPGYKFDVSSAAVNVARFTVPSNGYIDISDGTGNFRVQMLSNVPHAGTTTNNNFNLIANNVVRATVGTTGDFSLANGNFVVSTSGKGVSLPGGITWTSGTGSPEGVVTAPVGSLYSRSDGGVLTSLYVKQSGSGNTGWAGK